MARQYWRPSNMLYPIPAVMVSCVDSQGKMNVMTAAWAGTICSDPVMVSVSIRKERYSHAMIEETGEFVINLTTRKLAKVTDYVGVRSGRDVDKFNLEGDLHITAEPARLVKAPCIKESPICLECKVTQILRLGTHDMFIAEVVSTDVDEQYLDETGRLDLTKADLIAYSHGEYYTLGESLGKFGYSVRKKPINKGASSTQGKKPTSAKSAKTSPKKIERKTASSKSTQSGKKSSRPSRQNSSKPRLKKKAKRNKK